MFPVTVIVSGAAEPSSVPLTVTVPVTVREVLLVSKVPAIILRLPPIVRSSVRICMVPPELRTRLYSVFGAETRNVVPAPVMVNVEVSGVKVPMVSATLPLALIAPAPLKV